LDVDVRCACVKDPNSKLCEMVKAGFYEPHDFSKTKPLLNGITGSWTGAMNPPTRTTPARSPSIQPARPQPARVVPLAHKDYLRFLHPNARLAVGFDFSKLLAVPEIMAGLFGQNEHEGNPKLIAALKEMNNLWLSFAAPNDFLVLMTGRFEQGAASGLFYAQGVRPVFLGGAQAMLIGPEPSIQEALARLAKPAVAGGWVARRAREMAKDHETWIINEPAPGTNQAAALSSVRQFALGFRLAGEGMADGELTADSETTAEQIAAWVEKMKAALRGNAGPGLLDSLTIERTGPTVRFAYKGDSARESKAADSVLRSDFGAELYAALTAGFPGMPPRAVGIEKLRGIKTGMTREQVLALLGRPLGVTSIQGLEVPRETWTYQVPFGKQYTLRIEGGVVTQAPNL
jgi:hypothetical protein